MAKPLVDDELWAVIEPLLPEPKARRFRLPGRKLVDNRRALTGIVFVLKTGIGWEDLPQEMGCGSGMTCWRRLRDWQAAGVWQRLIEAIPAVRGQVGQPRRRSDRIQGDRGYDSEPNREWLRRLGIEPHLAKRNTPHGSGPGVYQWVVERTLSSMHQFRRLRCCVVYWVNAAHASKTCSR